MTVRPAARRTDHEAGARDRTAPGGSATGELPAASDYAAFGLRWRSSVTLPFAANL